LVFLTGFLITDSFIIFILINRIEALLFHMMLQETTRYDA